MSILSFCLNARFTYFGSENNWNVAVASCENFRFLHKNGHSSSNLINQIIEISRKCRYNGFNKHNLWNMRLKYEAKVTHKTLMIKKCDRCHWKGVSLCTQHRLMTQKTLTRTNWSYNSAKLPIDRNKNHFYIKGCVFFACSMICREIMLQKDYRIGIIYWLI